MKQYIQITPFKDHLITMWEVDHTRAVVEEGQLYNTIKQVEMYAESM